MSNTEICDNHCLECASRFFFSRELTAFAFCEDCEMREVLRKRKRNNNIVAQVPSKMADQKWSEESHYSLKTFFGAFISRLLVEIGRSKSAERCAEKDKQESRVNIG